MPKRKGWKLEVWENLGWHFCLTNAPISIYESCGTIGGSSFFTLVADRPDETGYGTMKMHGIDTHAKTPKASAKLAMKAFKKIVEDQIACWDKIKAAIESNGVK